MGSKLSLENVSYEYPDGTSALEGVSLEVISGEVAFILGPNGSGKTTLLLIMAGLLNPSSGQVLFNGNPLEKEFRRICGFLFQDPRDQLIAPSVWEDVAIAPRQLDVNDVKKRVDDALRFFDIEGLANRSPFRLSQGQAARVALAGLLAQDPQVLLLDEPWSSLDLDGVNKLMEMINSYRIRGKIVVISSQDSGIAAELADRVFVLNHGKLALGGRAEDVLTNTERLLELGVRPPPAPLIFRNLMKGDPPLRIEDLAARLKSILGDCID